MGKLAKVAVSKKVAKESIKPAKKSASLASKLAEVDPEFCEFLKTEDSDLLADLGNEEAQDDDDLGELDEDIDDEEDDEDEEEVDGMDNEDDDDDDDSDGIVPLSDDEEELDEEDEEDEEEVDERAKQKSDKKHEGSRVLTMAQIQEWSQYLSVVMSGEAPEKEARKVIDQLVAALRCSADKMRPVESAADKEKDKKTKKAGNNDEEDEDEESAGKKKKKSRKTQSSSMAGLFSHVGAREFHAVVNLCLSKLVPSLLSVLRGSGKPEISQPADPASKKALLQRAHQLRSSECWSRLKLSIRVYIETLVDLIKYTSDESVATQLIEHLNTDDAQILSLALPSTRRALIQTVVSMWSKGCLLSSTELLDQCLALIISTVRNCPPAKVSTVYDRIFRRLYRAYMAACRAPPKQGSADDASLKIISTMRSHLASFVLSAPLPAMAHALSFVKIRQLCSQLRAALSAASAETRARSVKVVLSWPFLRCIDLWSDVIATSSEGHAVRQLVYPLTQLTIGAARLQSSPRYYPLRYHCVRFLNRIAQTTNTFIPSLSLILDVFAITDFNAAATTKSTAGAKDDDRRIFSLDSLLHFSESQLRDPGIEGGMLDSVVADLFYVAAAEALAAYAHRVAFPELSLAYLVRLKKFVKACHVPRFVEKMKVLLSKIEENSRWIEERRRSASDLHPANSAAVTAWENEAKAANPPMALFFSRLIATVSLAKSTKKRYQNEAKNQQNNRKRVSTDDVVKAEPSDPKRFQKGNKNKGFNRNRKMMKR